MPIQHVLWRIADRPKRLLPGKLDSEKQLEGMIVAEPSILSSDWMLIGRQERTSYGKIIDLLAVAPDGSLVLIELKRHQTPWAIVAQALDYASWVAQLQPQEIAEIYRRFKSGAELAEDFKARFHTDLVEDQLNASHQIVIVAVELDDSTERITRYLSDRDVPINVVLFRVFEDANEKLLSRVWLMDPNETQADAVADDGKRQPWNGEYYVSYGGYSWNDARKYGFICAGDGLWYSNTLKSLCPGDRIWVNIPGTGYVGVGTVTEQRTLVTDFEVDTQDGRRPVLEVLTQADEMKQRANDPDKADYFVRVEWLDTRAEKDAAREVGFFGNQNTVCRPRSIKWAPTVERLKTYFPNWQGAKGT